MDSPSSMDNNGIITHLLLEIIIMIPVISVKEIIKDVHCYTKLKYCIANRRLALSVKKSNKFPRLSILILQNST